MLQAFIQVNTNSNKTNITDSNSGTVSFDALLTNQLQGSKNQLVNSTNEQNDLTSLLAKLGINMENPSQYDSSKLQSLLAILAINMEDSSDLASGSNDLLTSLLAQLNGSQESLVENSFIDQDLLALFNGLMNTNDTETTNPLVEVSNDSEEATTETKVSTDAAMLAASELIKITLPNTEQVASANSEILSSLSTPNSMINSTMQQTTANASENRGIASSDETVELMEMFNALGSEVIKPVTSENVSKNVLTQNSNATNEEAVNIDSTIKAAKDSEKIFVEMEASVVEGEADFKKAYRELNANVVNINNVEVKPNVENAVALETSNTTPDLSEYKVVEQVSVSINEQLAKAQDEFVIKLKPEGLGEVVVKLVNNGGNIEVNLITNNLQTKNYLSEQIGNLRDSLQSLDTQIKEVVYDNQSSYFSENNFSNEHGFENQRNHGTSFYQYRLDSEAIEEEINNNIDLLVSNARYARHI